MKILFVAPRFPYPLDRANNVATTELIKFLATRGHLITFCSLVDPFLKYEAFAVLKHYCEIRVLPYNVNNSFQTFIANFSNSFPYTIAKFFSWKMFQMLCDLLSQEHFDIAHIDLIQMAQYGYLLKKKFNISIVLRLHNCETTQMRRRYESESNLLLKACYYLDWKKLRRYESFITRFFDRCLMMTKKDKEDIEVLNPCIKTAIVPQGVDTSYFFPIHNGEEPYSLITVSPLDWRPHVQGIKWFVDKVFPMVKRSYPTAKLYVVGKNPKKESFSASGNSVIITGFIEDIRDLIARSTVYIVPLKAGSGLRMKILHAMAMGKPVVSTTIGCEGIIYTSGKNICVADTPEDFAGAIIELFKNKDKRLMIGQSGLELINKHYRWEKVVEKLEEEYHIAINLNKGQRCI